MKKVCVLSMFSLCIFMVFLVISKSAYANAIATSYAELDWSGLTYSVSPSDGLSKSFLIVDFAGSSADYFYQDTGGSRYGASSYLDGKMTAESLATAIQDGASYEARSSSAVRFNLGVQGSGIITVSIPYILITDLYIQLQGPRWNDVAIADAAVSLYAHSLGVTDAGNPVQWWADDTAHLNKISTAVSGSGLRTEQGVLSISIPFMYPSTYPNSYGGVYFDAGSSAHSAAYSQIPEPTTMLLLCFGIVGLVSIRKRH